MGYSKVETHVTQALENLVQQFKDKPKLAAWITSYINQIQDLEYMWYDLLVERWLENAVGIQLDNFGTIVDELRQGKSDDDYRLAIQGKISLLRSAGTPTDVIEGMKIFAAGSYDLLESYPATIRVTLVDALTSSFPTAEQFAVFLNKVKPAGVRAWFQYSLEADEDTFEFSEYGDELVLPYIDVGNEKLVSAYRMINVGGTVADLKGVNNGTLSGDVYQREGGPGYGLRFDGSTGYLDCGTGFNSLEAVTASFWLKAGDVTTINFPFNNWLNASDAWGVYILSGNLYIFDDIDNAQASLYGTSVSVDTWYHVVATMSPTTHENKLYINGVLVGSGTNSSDDWASFAGNIYFGSRSTAAQFFNGQIADPQIWSVEKDASWVLAEYTRGIAAIAANENFYDYPVARADIDIDDPSLVAGYRMKPTNGVTGSNVPNLVDGADAAVNNGATFEYGEMGDSLLFGGVSDFVNIGDAGLALTDNFTLSAWVKTDVAGSDRIVGRADGSGTDFLWVCNTGTGVPVFYDGSNHYGADDISDGEWHYVVVVISGSSSQQYVDGSTSGNTFTASITALAGSTLIGASGTGTTGNWDGHIVDPQIHSEAKDLAWVQAEYAKGVAAQAANALNATQGWGGDESYGPELITNGTFDSDISGWTNTDTDNWVYSAGTASASGLSASCSMYQDITTVIGETYNISGDIDNVIGNVADIYTGTTSVPLGNLVGSKSSGDSGTVTDSLVATETTTRITLRGQDAGAGFCSVAMDNISAKSIIPGIPGGAWADVHVIGE